ncbi:MAG: NAD(P)H-hydrate dehydratase [Rhodobacteraceae bacterium]|nr:NAD(P)H-hydrate dehydratase [Paracoccaceae bacterium]
MTQLLTAAQMRKAELSAIEAGMVTGLELMERAGRGVIEAVFAHWPDLALDGGSAPAAAPLPRGILKEKKTAVILCGPGNNGGDGFVVARLLHGQGWEVNVFLYGDVDRLPPDAAENHRRWAEIGEVTCRAIDPPPLMDDSLHVRSHVDLVVDALFGTGLTRSFGGLFAMFADPTVQAAMAGQGTRTVAVDVPTGLCSDSGRVLGVCIPADLTVTFHSMKPGHHLADGPAMCGAVRVVDIGLNTAPPCAAEELSHIAKPPAPSLLTKSTTGHKFSHGHALVLTGGAGRTGAARLAGRAALRVGAGLVTLAVPGAAQQEVACQITALMLHRVDDGGTLAEVLKDDRLTALCLGPGLGLSERQAGLVAAALEARRPTVLDADALSLVAADKALAERVHDGCVLTPHMGEFRRLFPDLADRLEGKPRTGPAFSKLDAARAAAARAGCHVLIKGPDTVIAAPEGAVTLQSSYYGQAVPWLATAGAGDVLAGIICGLLARGLDTGCAAAAGAWLHSAAARRFGPGLIAEDLPEQIPAVLRDLGA